MKNVARLIAESTRERYVVLGRTIYAVRRADSDALRHVGFAALEGAASVREAMDRIGAEQADEVKRLNGMPADQRAAAQAEVMARLTDLGQRRLQAMVATPSGDAAMLERCTAYLCAAVVGAGMLRADASDFGSVAVLADQVEPSSVAEDLRDEDEIAAGVAPTYLAPIRYVRSQAEEDLDAGRVWVQTLSIEQRSALGMVVIGLQSVASEVTPFRRAAGAAGGDLEAGNEVREVATRGPGADSVADGVRGGVPAGGRGRGRARGR